MYFVRTFFSIQQRYDRLRIRLVLRRWDYPNFERPPSDLFESRTQVLLETFPVQWYEERGAHELGLKLPYNATSV